MADFGAVELTDIAAAPASVFALLALLWLWRPRSNADGASEEDVEPDPRSGGVATAVRTHRSDTRTAVVRAFAPCAIIIGLFSISSMPQIAEALEQIIHEFSWPGLNVLSADGEPSTLTKVEPDWLANGGTVLLIAGLITVVVLGLCWREEAARTYGATSHQLRTAAVTVMAVPAIACARNLSGQPARTGLMLAGVVGCSPRYRRCWAGSALR